MLNEHQVAILGAILREAGPEAALAADRILDVAPAQRPKIIGEAIARFGRDKDVVRLLAKPLDLGGWLGGEVKERVSVQSQSADPGI